MKLDQIGFPHQSKNVTIKNCHIYRKGPSINDVASLEGGRRGQIDDMGRYEGVGVKENPISSIQDRQIWTSFLDGP